MPANAERVRALHERLTAQVEALVTGEDWARFLTVASRFHTYSTGAGRYSKSPNSCSRGVIAVGLAQDRKEAATPKRTWGWLRPAPLAREPERRGSTHQGGPMLTTRTPKTDRLEELHQRLTAQAGGGAGER